MPAKRHLLNHMPRSRRMPLDINDCRFSDNHITI
jgi:hypothetical protein